MFVFCSYVPSGDTHGKRTFTKRDTHGERSYMERRHRHMEWGYIRRRDTHEVEIHMEKGHIWSWDTYGKGTDIERRYTDIWSGGTYGKGTYMEWEYIRGGETHKDGIHIRRRHTPRGDT